MNNNQYVEIDSETVNIVDQETKNVITIINNNSELISILKQQEWYVDDTGDVVADKGKLFLNNIVWKFFRAKH